MLSEGSGCVLPPGMTGLVPGRSSPRGGLPARAVGTGSPDCSEASELRIQREAFVKHRISAGHRYESQTILVPEVLWPSDKDTGGFVSLSRGPSPSLPSLHSPISPMQSRLS